MVQKLCSILILMPYFEPISFNVSTCFMLSLIHFLQAYMLAGLSGGFLTFFISMSMLLGRFISSIIKRQWNQQSPKYAISVVLIDLIWLFSTFTMWSIIQIFLFAQHKLLISFCHHASAMIFQKQSLSITGICTVWH